MTLRLPMTNALHGLRFIAAILVVMHHELLPRDRTADTLSSAVSAGGYLGVTVFFVLSGFVISYKYWDDFQVFPSSAYWPFMVRRFARIYPLYFVLLMAHYALSGHISHPLLSLTMTQALFPNLYGVGIGQAWTLTVEMSFYLVAPVLIFLVGTWAGFGRIFAVAVLIALVLQFSFNYNPIPYSHFIAFNTLAGRLSEFLLGMGAAKIAIEWPQRLTTEQQWPLIDIAIVISFVALVAFIGYYDSHVGVTGSDTIIGWIARDLFAVLCTVSVLRLMVPAGPLYLGLSSRVMTAWGKYSYAIYLVHGETLGIQLGPPNSFLVEIALIILVAQFLYNYIEEPLRRTVTSALDWRPKLAPIPQPRTSE